MPNPFDTPPGGDAPDTPAWLRFLRGINYCDIDRYPGFAPPGDAVAALWQLFTRGTECPCCLGTRLLLALGLVALATGSAVYAVLT